MKSITVATMIDHYQTWADAYYRKPGSRRPTGEAEQMAYALRTLRQVAGDMPLTGIGAETICACQEAMIRAGISRRTINARINRIKRAIRWAARPPRRWIPAAVIEDVGLVEPLRKGRTDAPETAGVRAVTEEDFRRTLAAIAEDGLHAGRSLRSLELSTMLEVHWYTGMRPGELVHMRRSELADEGAVIVYRPTEYKTQHHDAERVIVMGPMAQAALRPWLRRVKGDKVWRFSRTSSYYTAIRRINQRHGIPHWHPNQIRHAAATRLDQVAGIEAARVALGHATTRQTEVYIDRDHRQAVRLMSSFG